MPNQQITKYCFCLILAASLTACGGNEIDPKDLAGNWSIGTELATIESANDGSLKVTNERKVSTTGKIVGNALSVEGWKITGELSEDKKSVKWSNGTVWQR